MQDSVSIGTKRRWEFLLAAVIAVHMAFLSLAFLFGSIARLIQGSHSPLSLIYSLIGFAIIAFSLFTAYWTLFRMRRSIVGFCALTLLLAAQLAIYPRLPDATGVLFNEIATASVGFVVYLVPLLLLLRVRTLLRT